MLLKALLVSAAGIVAVTLPAVAEETFVAEVGAPTTDKADLVPGLTTQQREVLVRNQALDTSELHLQARNLVDDDNGCVRPETRDGDTTCGVGGGELSDWMRITVTRLGSPTDEQLWTGTLAELADGAVLESAMPAEAEWRLRLTSELPREAGNDTQTDRVSYDLRWTMSSERGPDDVDIAGVEAEAAGGGAAGGGPGLPGSGIVGGLPATGTTVGLLLLLTTAGLLTAGSIMISASRRRAVTS